MKSHDHVDTCTWQAAQQGACGARRTICALTHQRLKRQGSSSLNLIV